VWPASGDRVWVADAGSSTAAIQACLPEEWQREFVKYSTEISSAGALVTFRLNHPALDSFPRPRVSAPNFPGPQSFLPVTGVPAALPPNVLNLGPTAVR